MIYASSKDRFKRELDGIQVGVLKIAEMEKGHSPKHYTRIRVKPDPHPSTRMQLDEVYDSIDCLLENYADI